MARIHTQAKVEETLADLKCDNRSEGVAKPGLDRFLLVTWGGERLSPVVEKTKVFEVKKTSWIIFLVVPSHPIPLMLRF